MRYIYLTGIILLFSFGVACGRKEVNSDILGYTESELTDDSTIVYVYGEHIPYFKPVLDDYVPNLLFVGSTSSIDIKSDPSIELPILYNRFKITNDGRTIISLVEVNKDEQDIIVFRYLNNQWKQEQLGLNIQLSFEVYGYAISPDGSWGLLTYFDHVSERYNDSIRFKNLKSTTYKIDYTKMTWEETTEFSTFGNKVPIDIIDNKFLYTTRIEFINRFGIIRDTTKFLFVENCDESNPKPEFVHHYSYHITDRRNLAPYVYTDKGELRILYQKGELTYYKAYTEEMTEITDIFILDFPFIKACTDGNGDIVVGIAKSKDGESFVIYEINTITKEYAKYPLDLSEEEIEKIKLLNVYREFEETEE